MKYLIPFIILLTLYSCEHETYDYYETGELKSKCVYKSQENKNGICNEYYKNGRQKSIIQYVDGEINGRAIFYRKNGDLEAKVEFKNGIRHGLTEQYSHENKVESRIPYVNGNIHGVVNFFNEENMNPEKISFYKKGKYQHSLYTYYDSSSNSKRTLKIDPIKDTISLGEKYRAKIEVNSLENEDVIIFCNIGLKENYNNGKYLYIDTSSTNPITSEKWVEYKPLKKNKYILYVSVGVLSPHFKGMMSFGTGEQFIVK